MVATPDQLTDQVTRHQAFTEGLKTQEFNELKVLLADAHKTIIADLSGNDIRGWTRSQLERRLATVESLIKVKYSAEIIPELQRKIREFSVYEAEFEKKSLKNVVDYNFEVPAENQIMSAINSKPLSVTGPDKGKLLDSFVQDWTQKQTTQTVNAIRAGFAIGQTTTDIIKDLKRDVFPQGMKGLDMMVRTSLQHSAAVAREETFKANSDLIKRVRFIATLDSRTTIQCQALDGQVFKLSEGPRPPLHVGCRSTFEAVLDERFDFLDKGGTRRLCKL